MCTVLKSCNNWYGYLIIASGTASMYLCVNYGHHILQKLVEISYFNIWYRTPWSYAYGYHTEVIVSQVLATIQTLLPLHKNLGTL